MIKLTQQTPQGQPIAKPETPLFIVPIEKINAIQSKFMENSSIPYSHHISQEPTVLVGFIQLISDIRSSWDMFCSIERFVTNCGIDIMTMF